MLYVLYMCELDLKNKFELSLAQLTSSCVWALVQVGVRNTVKQHAFIKQLSIIAVALKTIIAVTFFLRNFILLRLFKMNLLC